MLRSILISLAVFAATSALADPLSPLERMKQIRSYMRGLSSFGMTLEHHDSSGLFPGDYKQSLKWRKGGRFELVVTSPGNERVPNYYADGHFVHSVTPKGVWSSDDLAPQPNMEPGWEVSGGILLSWLQRTPNGDFFFNPPNGFHVDWSYGPSKTWRGRTVAVAEMKMTFTGGSQLLHCYLDPERPLIFGIEWEGRDGKPRGASFNDLQVDPKLPATLGSIPAVLPPSLAKSGMKRKRGATAKFAPSHRVSAKPLPAGWEYRYRGTASFDTEKGRETLHPDPLLVTATLVPGSNGSPRVIRFRRLPDLKEVGRPFGNLVAGVSVVWEPKKVGGVTQTRDGLLTVFRAGLADALDLPRPFDPALLAKAVSASNPILIRGPFLNYQPSFPQVLPMWLKVVKTETVGGHRCRVADRYLGVSLPFMTQAYEQKILGSNERFWIEESTGLLIRYSGRVSILEGENRYPFILATELRYQDRRRLSAQEIQDRLAQEETLGRAEMQLNDRSSNPGFETRLDRAEKILADFKRRHATGAYASAAIPLRQWLDDEQGRNREKLARDKLVSLPVPTFTLKDVEGNDRKLEDYAGKIVLLNFFASWCGPCHEEAPHLEKEYWEKFRDQGLMVLGIDSAENGDAKKAALAFAKQHQITYPMLIDEKSEVAKKLHVQGFPTNVVIDRKGVARSVMTGFDPDRLTSVLAQLLAEK